MLDQQGLGDQSIRIKRLLFILMCIRLMPKECQLVLFSATFTDALREYVGSFYSYLFILGNKIC